MQPSSSFFRTLSTSSSLPLRSLFSLHTKDVNWQRLVTKTTSPLFISKMKELEGKFNDMKMETQGAPKSIESIDWSYWSSHITDKAAVAELKHEYESFVVPKFKGLDLTEINESLDKSIKKSEENAVIFKEKQSEISLSTKTIKEELYRHDRWNVRDHLARWPGLREQIVAVWKNGFFYPSVKELELAESDITEVRKKFAENGQFTPIELSSVSKERFMKYGPMDIDAELAEWEKTEEKLWGESEEWKKVKKQEKADQLEKEKKEKAMQHHH